MRTLAVSHFDTNTNNKEKTGSTDLQVSDGLAESLPLHDIIPGLLKYELGAR